MSVSRRLNGVTPFSATEILLIADYLKVEPSVLMPKDDVA